MDTSETYIKMCEKAEEIQEGKGKIERGDCWCWKSYPSKVYFRTEKYPLEMLDSRNKRTSNNKIWLPRQDQLQEMVGDTPYYNIKNAMWSVLDDFRNFAFATNFKEYIPLTMEQLWLAFVMKEKHSKIWNGNAWQFAEME